MAAARVVAVAVPEAGTDLAAAIEHLVLASGEDGATPVRDAARRLVLEHAKAAALRGRSWFLAMGFDSDPAAVPPIATMLDSFTLEDMP